MTEQDTWLDQLAAMERLIVPGAVFDYTAVYQDGQPHRTVTVLEVRSNNRVTFEVEGETYMKYRRSMAEGLLNSLAVRLSPSPSGLTCVRADGCAGANVDSES
jgi:hypothetical protein